MEMTKNLPWAHYDIRIRVDLPPRERIQRWLQVTREMWHDPLMPRVGTNFEVEGNMRIVALENIDGDNSSANFNLKRPHGIFAFDIPYSFASVTGNLAGSSTCHLIDRASMLLLTGAAREGWWDQSAVSMGLDVKWMLPNALGETIFIDVVIESMTKSFCEYALQPPDLTDLNRRRDDRKDHQRKDRHGLRCRTAPDEGGQGSIFGSLPKIVIEP